MAQSTNKQQKQQKLHDEAVLCAKYLWNMLHLEIPDNEDIEYYQDVPFEHKTDYWRYCYEEIKINNITADDIVFGYDSIDNEEDEEIEGEEIVYRGKDNFFGYTTEFPREVIAIAKIYRFKDLNLPDSSKICCPRKNDRVLGMYASDLQGEDGIDIEVKVEYDWDDWNKETSFYEIFFNGVNLYYIYDKAFYENDNYGNENVSRFSYNYGLCDFSITDDSSSLVHVNKVREEYVW